MQHSDLTTYDATAELDSLKPPLRLDRRGFVKTSLGAGFAAAVLPVQAQTMITTDTQGLTAGEVKIPTKDGWRDARLPRAAGRQDRAADGAGGARRSSACTSTSRTSRGGWRSRATWPLRRNCMRAMATSRP